MKFPEGRYRSLNLGHKLDKHDQRDLAYVLHSFFYSLIFCYTSSGTIPKGPYRHPLRQIKHPPPKALELGLFKIGEQLEIWTNAHPARAPTQGSIHSQKIAKAAKGEKSPRNDERSSPPLNFVCFLCFFENHDYPALRALCVLL
jgi:hypothetical protein